METSNLIRFKSILNRYKLAYRALDDDYIEIGGGHNIKYLKLYYFYLPFGIGSIIVLIGFLIDFIIFKFCGLPFLLYAIYGISQINIAIKENRNTTVVRNGEIRISMNDTVNVLSAKNIRDYEIKTERLDDKLHLCEFSIIDKKNNKFMFLTLIDDELSILKENMKFLKEFIQANMNATNIK